VIFRKTTKTSDRIQTCFQSKNNNTKIIRKWENGIIEITPYFRLREKRIRKENYCREHITIA
jgi:hypothetical protein